MDEGMSTDTLDTQSLAAERMIHPPVAAAAGSRVVFDPTPHDIIMGRGVPLTKYKGNIQFRELIQTRKAEYMSTGRHHIKQEVAKEVFEMIKEKQCRFLAKIETEAEAREHGLPPGTKAWYIVNDDVALTKVKQALREMESSSKSDAVSDPATPRRRRSRRKSSASAKSESSRKKARKEDHEDTTGQETKPPPNHPGAFHLPAAFSASSPSVLCDDSALPLAALQPLPQASLHHSSSRLLHAPPATLASNLSPIQQLWNNNATLSATIPTGLPAANPLASNVGNAPSVAALAPAAPMLSNQSFLLQAQRQQAPHPPLFPLTPQQPQTEQQTSLLPGSLGLLSPQSPLPHPSGDNANSLMHSVQPVSNAFLPAFLSTVNPLLPASAAPVIENQQLWNAWARQQLLHAQVPQMHQQPSNVLGAQPHQQQATPPLSQYIGQVPPPTARPPITTLELLLAQQQQQGNMMQAAQQRLDLQHQQQQFELYQQQQQQIALLQQRQQDFHASNALQVAQQQLVQQQVQLEQQRQQQEKRQRELDHTQALLASQAAVANIRQDWLTVMGNQSNSHHANLSSAAVTGVASDIDGATNTAGTFQNTQYQGMSSQAIAQTAGTISASPSIAHTHFPRLKSNGAENDEDESDTKPRVHARSEERSDRSESSSFTSTSTPTSAALSGKRKNQAKRH